MNILLFVTTMIMILASLTYARLEMYRSFSVMQSQFNQYMQKTERSQTNNTAKWWYENHHATTKVDKINNSGSKGNSYSRLSFYIFLDPERRKGHEKEFPLLQALAKKLMHLLYKDQPFYQEMEKKHPDFMNTLLASLELQARLPKEQQVKRVEDLGSLNLNDGDLNETLTKMLKGTAAQEKVPKEKEAKEKEPPTQVQEDPAEDDDAEEEKGKKREYNSTEGYYSLLDYITIKEAYKVRVYLAPQLLLTAIFDDPEIVKAVVETRNNMHKQIVNERITPAEATKQFENAFAPRLDPSFKEILDFTVTKTNPEHYE